MHTKSEPEYTLWSFWVLIMYGYRQQVCCSGGGCCYEKAMGGRAGYIKEISVPSSVYSEPAIALKKKNSFLFKKDPA